MKLSVIMLAASLLVPAAASAQSFVEFEGNRANGAWEPLVTAWVVHDVTKKDALTVWALTSRTWGEALVGYQRTVRPWCQVGLGVGLETDRDAWRVNPWFWVGHGKFSVFGSFEEGGSGFWYLAKVGYKAHGRLTVGAYSRQFVGTGVYAETTMVKNLSVLTALTRYEGGTQFTAALHHAF